MRLLSVCLMVPALLVPSRPAEACTAPQCWPGSFVPGDASTIPSNAPGLYWRPTSGGADPDPSSVTLTSVADPSTPLPFTATALPGGDHVLVPAAPLVEGTVYVLEDHSTCGGLAGPRVTFTAGPSAPLPTSLGTITTDPHGRREALEVASGASCSTTIDATVLGIELAPSPDVAPWMALLLFETVVDGQPWQVHEDYTAPPDPGASWKGRGRDLLFRICAPNPDAINPGLSAAGHQVAFRASLPDAQPISTPALGIELMCDPDPEDESSDGCASSTPTSSSLILLGIIVLHRRRRRGRARGAGVAERLVLPVQGPCELADQGDARISEAARSPASIAPSM